NRHAFYDDDDDDDVDYTIAITPVLSTEEPENSLKIVIPKVEEIEDDNLRKKLLNVHLLITNIEALKDNPTPSSELLTKSSSTSPKSFLEETNTFHNSLPEFENFYFDLEEINQFPPTDRSDFANEEFADELANIISPPEYDRFYFWNLPDLGELISSLNFGIRENLSSTTCVYLPVENDYSPLLAYVVWIFLAYLTYPVIPPYLHPFGNEYTIFDPGITINRVYSFKPALSHRKFNRFSFFETPKVLLLAWDRVFEIKDALRNKQYKPKDMQELFHKLSNDMQNIHDEWLSILILRVGIVLPSTTITMMMTWTTQLQSHPFYPLRNPLTP
nr:hypothetical protein [Tanacetum cinerariifolium]